MGVGEVKANEQSQEEKRSDANALKRELTAGEGSALLQTSVREEAREELWAARRRHHLCSNCHWSCRATKPNGCVLIWKRLVASIMPCWGKPSSGCNGCVTIQHGKPHVLSPTLTAMAPLRVRPWPCATGPVFGVAGSLSRNRNQSPLYRPEHLGRCGDAPECSGRGTQRTGECGAEIASLRWYPRRESPSARKSCECSSRARLPSR